MKINKYTFILPILFCVIIYLFGAFIAVDIDFTNWNTLGRLFTTIIFAFAIVIGVTLSQEIE